MQARYKVIELNPIEVFRLLLGLKVLTLLSVNLNSYYSGQDIPGGFTFLKTHRNHAACRSSAEVEPKSDQRARVAGGDEQRLVFDIKLKQSRLP